MRMRRWSAWVAFAFSTFLLLSACSKPAAPAPAPAPAPAAQPAEPVEITYAFWDQNQEPTIKSVIAKFNEKFPQIKVTTAVTPWGGYWEKLQTVVAGGEAYDVFWLNGPNFPFYASKGVLANLDEAMQSVAGNYPKALVDMYSYNGHRYAIPKDFDTIALFYNKDLFTAAGVPLPPSDWTWKWDDFVAAARLLTKDAAGKHPGEAGFDAKNVAQFGTGTDVGQTGHYNVVFSGGGWVISPDGKRSGYDDPATIEAVQKYLDLIHQEMVAPGTTLAGGAESNPYALFLGGKVGMFFGGSWMTRTFLSQNKFQVGLTYLPVLKQPATVIHGLGNVVFARSKHPKEALEFVKFLGSKDAADIFAKSGTVIPAFNGTQDAWVAAFPKSIDASIFIKATAHSFALPASVANVELAPVEQDTFDRLWAGKGDAKTLLTQLAQKEDQILAK